MAVVMRASGLEELEQRLSRLARTELDRELTRAIVDAAKPLPDAVRKSALDILPKRGGLNRRVAELVITTEPRAHGVRVFAVSQKRMRDLLRLDRGLVRHPVFADDAKTRREWVWVNQPVEKRFWSRPAKQREDAINAALRLAADRLAKTI